MRQAFFLLCAVFATELHPVQAQPAIRVEPPDPAYTGTLQSQTADAVIRNYLHAWDSLRAAFAQNRTTSLDQDFVGTAKEKLAATIRQQAALGFGTEYHDRAHNIKIVFASPEGLSVELEDDVDYEVQLLGSNKPTSKLNRKARYFVVLTPTETRWRVRVFQAEHD